MILIPPDEPDPAEEPDDDAEYGRYRTESCEYLVTFTSNAIHDPEQLGGGPPRD